MKRFEVHTLKKPISLWGRDTGKDLAEETEEFLNKKINSGYELVEISFHPEAATTGYFYAYIVLSI